jgi:hypothetical protein
MNESFGEQNRCGLPPLALRLLKGWLHCSHRVSVAALAKMLPVESRCRRFIVFEEWLEKTFLESDGGSNG